MKNGRNATIFSIVVNSQYLINLHRNFESKCNEKLCGRKVSDLSYYTFQSMLNYKCVKYGKKIIKIGQFEPSSLICSCCGHRLKLGLDERTTEDLVSFSLELG